MTGRLAGKVAIVTGAASGIGRACAQLFAAEGARVMCADLNAAGARETAQGIGAAAIASTVDVALEPDVKRMVQETVAAFGKLGVLYANAGIAEATNAIDMTLELWNRMIAINLKGVWLAMRHELNVMVAQGGGSIVNTGSIAGLVGLPTSSAYVAAKHGVIGLTKTAAIEYAQQKIRVNAVCPGYIETDMTKEVMTRRGEQIMAMVPYKRMGTAQEIAEMVCWLCSDRASYVSGAAYNVDGGFIAG